MIFRHLTKVTKEQMKIPTFDSGAMKKPFKLLNLLQGIATNAATPLNRLAFEPILHGEPKYGKFENMLWSLLYNNGRFID